MAKKQYTLHKPFSISFHVTEDGPPDPNWIDTPFQLFSKNAFDHWFCEVDNKRQQLYDLLLPFIHMSAMEGYYEVSTELHQKLSAIDDEKAETHLIIDEILGIIYGDDDEPVAVGVSSKQPSTKEN